MKQQALFEIKPVYHGYRVQALVLVADGAERVRVVVPEAPAAQVHPRSLPQAADAHHDHVFVLPVLARLQAVAYFRRRRLADLPANIRVVLLVLEALAKDFGGQLLDLVRFELGLEWFHIKDICFKKRI